MVRVEIRGDEGSFSCCHPVETRVRVFLPFLPISFLPGLFSCGEEADAHARLYEGFAVEYTLVTPSGAPPP